MKFLTVIIFILGINYCSLSLSEAEKQWLSSVKNTTWSDGAQGLIFNGDGMGIDAGIIDYNYAYSKNSDTGVYVTEAQFPPYRWYYYVLETDLIQYGPFLSSNEIGPDNSLKIIFQKQ